MAQTRYTILLDEPTVESLNELQEACRLSNRAAVFDLSLLVLEWLVKQQQEGYEVGRAKDGDFQPLLMPIKIQKPGNLKAKTRKESSEGTSSKALGKKESEREPV